MRRATLASFDGEPLKGVLILVENLPVPFDRRVWQEACALRDAGYQVSVICPKGVGYDLSREVIDDVHIYRYHLPVEGASAFGYLREYGTALTMSFLLSLRVWWKRGFDVIHACNPPDLFFLIGAFYRLFGKKFLFDHHDLNPELYLAKFGRKGLLYKVLVLLERLSFRTAQVSIATNESYRKIAIERGGMSPDKVFVVRSGPSLERMRQVPRDETLKQGRAFLVCYLGVMGKQEGVDDLLRAVRHIVRDQGRTDVHFGIIGGGTSLPELRRMAGDLDIADFVTFTGRVPDDIMLSYLNTADVCVNPDKPSVMNDLSTMNKIMEYMALGKPIVQFDLREGRHSAQQASLYARCGDVQDFAAQILTLLGDPALRTEMGEFGRRRVLGHLQWRHQVPHLLEAYSTLWARRGSEAPAHRQAPGHAATALAGALASDQDDRTQDGGAGQPR
ncbi:MAG: glycosyltransferase family 4 protein [Pseudomonadota bacterium]|nr:glycosyltransferase family 4 protein [Pseudomonadota bacterium]